MTCDYNIHLRVHTALGYVYPKLCFLGVNGHYNVNRSDVVEIFYNLFQIVDEHGVPLSDDIFSLMYNLNKFYDDRGTWRDRFDCMNPLMYKVSRLLDLDLVIIDEYYRVHEISTYTKGSIYNSRDDPPEYIVDWNQVQHIKGTPEYEILQNDPMVLYLEDHPDTQWGDNDSDCSAENIIIEDISVKGSEILNDAKYGVKNELKDDEFHIEAKNR